MQDICKEIYESKYQLKDSKGVPIDKDIDDTLRRVAKALAAVEKNDSLEWEIEFYQAMKNGCIPAGRILSNAGAGNYKPNTSLINCTVSQTIDDSIEGIMESLKRAAVTLATGAGIGYNFDSIRPRGAYISGAGAKTSGVIPFMEIFDTMCSTINSAGGRRGAQMGTLSISHPDIEEFITAKRTNGKLRQFNLSVLVTDKFMESLDKDLDWNLEFPTTDRQIHESDPNYYWKEVDKNYISNSSHTTNKEGNKIRYKIYKTVKAKYLWDLIMKSTFDYAEPGILFVDRINNGNVLNGVEYINATNPCVTGDTRLHTQHGMVQIKDLYDASDTPEGEIVATVDTRTLSGELGATTRPSTPAFMTSTAAEVFEVTTEAGYSVKATAWHNFHVGEKGNFVKLADLQIGDKLWIQSGKGQFGTMGSRELGEIIGLLTGDGHFTNRGKGQIAARLDFWVNDSIAARMLGNIKTLLPETLASGKAFTLNVTDIPDRGMQSIRSTVLADYLTQYNFNITNKLRVPEVIFKGTEDCVKGYLAALFYADGTVNISGKNKTSCSVRLSSSYIDLLKDVQILLSNFGIFGAIYFRRKAGMRSMPDGKGGMKEYFCQANYELIIDGVGRNEFVKAVGFLGTAKDEKASKYITQKANPAWSNHGFMSKVSSITFVGVEPVYDVTQKDKNSVIFNGLSTGQCAEQPLPPNGACLLGSINLTKFVRYPFTKDAIFAYGEFHKNVKIFARMLDNVVEISNLPLEEQQEEIKKKRRHGMGITGLGSAMSMLNINYGSKESILFVNDICEALAIFNLQANIELAEEKGEAPIFLKHSNKEQFVKALQKNEVYSNIIDDYNERVFRWTHATSIAPTGTISLSLGENCSNGIEPSYQHKYLRNIIKEGKATKQQVEIYSYEYLLYKELFGKEPDKDDGRFRVADDIHWTDHLVIQAAAQRWIDSAISKTINLPTDISFEEFKDVYKKAYTLELKGVTTFRFNPETLQGVLVKEEDLKKTSYKFTLKDGTVVIANGNDDISYKGEVTKASNLYDAIKEGYYGRH